MDERKLFSAIARSYLAAIGPDWVYDRTEISARPPDRTFAAAGLVEVAPGWREAMSGEGPSGPAQEQDGADSTARLPAWPDGATVRVVAAGTDKKTTKPPPRYTEGSLIKAMQEAWRFACRKPKASARRRRATPSSRA